MRFLKLAAYDVGAAMALFLVGAMVAAAVHAANPDCYTCGATVGNTVFFTAFLALQPALWPRDYDRGLRRQAWLLGSSIGIIVYVAVELSGTLLFISGRMQGLMLGSLANSVGPLVGMASCRYWLVTRERERFGVAMQPSTDVARASYPEA